MAILRRNRFRWWAVLAAIAVAVVAVIVYSGRDRGAVSQPATTSSVLALTWAPALCGVEPGASGCRTGRVGARGPAFLLHGLWPQPKSQQYCGVSREAKGRAPLTLPQDLRATLSARMSDASVMAPHEWYAHGTCSGVGAPEYFRAAVALTDQATAVLDPLFGAARGSVLSARDVRAAFDGRFGAGAGARVTLSCRGSGAESVVYEVRVSLPAVAELGDTSLAEALRRAPAVPPGCGRARVL